MYKYTIQTPLLHRYWRQVGGILIEEFPAVLKGPNQERRRIDGIIIRSKRRAIAKPGEVALKGRHIIVIQCEGGRLGMYLMGQAFFSAPLMKKFKPASVRAVALCEESDAVLGPLFERYRNCKVVVLSKEHRRTNGSRRQASLRSART